MLYCLIDVHKNKVGAETTLEKVPYILYNSWLHAEKHAISKYNSISTIHLTKIHTFLPQKRQSQYFLWGYDIWTKQINMVSN